jgi:hypothetical protein
MLNRLIGENIDLIWKPGNDLWAIQMDARQVDLCVNARDSIRDIGRITIETRNLSTKLKYEPENNFFNKCIIGEYLKQNHTIIKNETMIHGLKGRTSG